MALIAVPLGGAVAQMGGGRMGGGMGWGNMSGMMTGFGAHSERPRQLPPGSTAGRARPFVSDDGTYRRQLDGRDGQTRNSRVSPWGNMTPFTDPAMRWGDTR
jgi:hypothetical protein